MNALLKEIGQVAIFLVCAQTLLHFRAKDSYEKYIKLLISMMLLILLAEPFLDLLSMDTEIGFMEKVYGYEQKIESVMGAGLMKEEDIEDFLIDVMAEKLEEGVAYVKSMELQEESLSEVAAEENASNAVKSQIIIEKIEVGGQNGES